MALRVEPAMTDNHENELIEIRQGLDAIRSELPARVDASDLNTKSKIPFKALCCRAALLWRVEELGRSACHSIDQEDFVAAIVLTRSLIETAVALRHLNEIVTRSGSVLIWSPVDAVRAAIVAEHRSDKD
jgi:hypothetical protein